MTVSATDEAGKPARAIVNLSVVNQSVITMADEKTLRGMPTHFALVGEVKQPEELEHADFLLNETHPKAFAALDLLLGVQGWRRFAEQNPEKFRKDYSQEAERVLVMTGQSQTLEVNTQQAQFQEIGRSYEPRLKDADEKLRLASLDQAAVVGMQAEFEKLYQERRSTVDEATTDLSSARRSFDNWNDWRMIPPRPKKSCETSATLQAKWWPPRKRVD